MAAANQDDVEARCDEVSALSVILSPGEFIVLPFEPEQMVTDIDSQQKADEETWTGDIKTSGPVRGNGASHPTFGRAAIEAVLSEKNPIRKIRKKLIKEHTREELKADSSQEELEGKCTELDAQAVQYLLEELCATSVSSDSFDDLLCRYSVLRIQVLPHSTAPLAPDVRPLPLVSGRATSSSAEYDLELDPYQHHTRTVMQRTPSSVSMAVSSFDAALQSSPDETDSADGGTVGQIEEINYSWAQVLILLPVGYPGSRSLLIWLEDSQNLTDTEQVELENAMRSRANDQIVAGAVAGLEVFNIAQEFLLEHNERPASLFDEMILRNAQSKELQRTPGRSNSVRVKPSSANKKSPHLRALGLFSESGAGLEDMDPELEALVGMELRRQTNLPHQSVDAPLKTDFANHTGPAAIINAPFVTSVPSLDAADTLDSYFPARALTSQELSTWKRRDESDVGVVRGDIGSRFLAVTAGQRVLDVLEVHLPPALGKVGTVTYKSFRRMLEILETLRTNSHPHLVGVLGVETEETASAHVLRIFTEPVSGTVVSMMAFGTIDESIVRKFAAQLVSALQHLHRKHLVHRDIKVESILVSNTGSIKLAHASYGYLLRELRRGDAGVRHDERFLRACDVFDLAMTLLKMLGSQEKAIPDRLSAPAKDFLSQCLRRDWTRRPDVGDLMLHEFIAGYVGAAALRPSVVPHAREMQAQLIPLTPEPTPPPSATHSHADSTNDSSSFSREGTNLDVTSRLREIVGQTRREENRTTVPDDLEPSDSDSATAAGAFSVSVASTPLASSSAAITSSRFGSEFEEVEVLGSGAFGVVTKVRNVVDSQVYAVKKVKLFAGEASKLAKVMREVHTLAGLNHRHVVRYYNAWLEPIRGNERGFDEFSDSSSPSSSGEYGKNSDDNSPFVGETDDDASDIVFDEDATAGDDWFGTVAKNSIGLTRSSAGRPLTLSQHNSVFDASSESESDVDVIFEHTADNDDGDDVVFGDDTGVDALIDIQKSLRTNKKRRQPDTMLYIQMEYCDPKTLRQVIDEGMFFSDEDARWEVLRQLLLGLKHLHGLGLLHRDLKPANVFFSADTAEVKIGDFGLATTGVQHVKVFGEHDGGESTYGFSDSTALTNDAPTFEATRANVGTPLYCAPEQEISSIAEVQRTAGTRYNFKVDIYAVGIIFFEMCWRFGSGMERIHMITSMKRAPEPDEALPEAFREEHTSEAELIAWCLRRDPRDRPSAAEILSSDHMPRRMEEEVLREALHQVTDRSTALFDTLMERLFAAPTDPHAVFTYEPHIILEANRPPLTASAIADYAQASAAVMASMRAGGNLAGSSAYQSSEASTAQDQRTVDAILSSGGGYEALTELFRATGGLDAAAVGSDELAIRERVSAAVAFTCSRHGALPFDSPVLMPVPTDGLLHANAVGRIPKLMDSTGQLLTLPADLALPFARYVVQHGISSARRFSIGKVYRRADTGKVSGTRGGNISPADTRSAIQEVQEAAFDIVSPNIRTFARGRGDVKPEWLIYDAEVVRVMFDVLDKFKAQLGEGELVVRVNHAAVFGAMLRECGVADAAVDPVCNAVTRWQQLDWDETSARLREQQLISSDSALAIGRYFKITRLATFERAISKLEMLLKRSAVARNALVELRSFVQHCRALGIDERIRMDLGMVLTPAYYSGIMFQAVHDSHGDILATGGRYDKLLNHFAVGRTSGSDDAGATLTSAGASLASAVGCIFNAERIVAATISHRRSLLRTVPGGRRHVAGSRVSDTEVLVGSIGQGMLSARVEVCSHLWGANVSSEYLLLDKSRSDRWPTYEQLGVPVLIIVRDKTWRSNRVVGVRNLRKSNASETEVPVSELASHVLALLAAVRRRRHQALDEPIMKQVDSSQRSEMSQQGTRVESATRSSQELRAPKATAIAGNSTHQIDVLLLDEVRKSRQKSLLERARTSVLPWCQKFDSPFRVNVLAINLPRVVLAAVAASFEDASLRFSQQAPRGQHSEPSGDALAEVLEHAGIHKAAQYVEQLSILWDTLQRFKALPLVVLFSTIENKFCVLFFPVV